MPFTATVLTMFPEAFPGPLGVSLIADGEANRLYAQYGFEPTTPKSIGMAQVIR